LLAWVVEKARGAEEIHIVLDKLSAHNTKAVAEFVEKKPTVHFHFKTPYSSCLNQVEIWFAKAERAVILGGHLKTGPTGSARIRPTVVAPFGRSWSPLSLLSAGGFQNGPELSRARSMRRSEPLTARTVLDD
jgi:hypothetical protein